MRVISNQSSGEMGHLIALAFKKKGAAVTIIEGPVTHSIEAAGIKILKYRFFDELALLLKKECVKQYDIVVHAAAVSDFKPSKTASTKIRSSKPLVLELKPTQKLIDTIKKISPKSCLVGFKLESSVNEKNAASIARPLFVKSGCDAVIANSIKNGYRGFILGVDGQILAKVNNKNKMAEMLVGAVSKCPHKNS